MQKKQRSQLNFNKEKSFLKCVKQIINSAIRETNEGERYARTLKWPNATQILTSRIRVQEKRDEWFTNEQS